MIYLYCMVAMCEISLKHQKEAQEALNIFCQHLAVQIHNLQAILDPEIFAVGGGISNQPALMEALQGR